MKRNLLLLVLMLWSYIGASQPTVRSSSPRPTPATSKAVTAPAQIFLDVEQARVLDAAVRERDELKLKERSYLTELYATRKQVRLERAANLRADSISIGKDVQLQAKDEQLTATISQLKRKKRQLVRAHTIQILEACIIGGLVYLFVLK